VAIYGKGARLRVGKNVRLSASVWLQGENCSLEIGDDCDIAGVIHILHAGASVRIGAGTTATGVGLSMHEAGELVIGAGCMFSTEIHMDVSDAHPIYDAASGERLNPPKPIVIEDRVWLGARVIVMKGATIGEGTVVGAGSIVVGTLPAGCLAAGIPARPLRENIVWRRDFNEPALVASAAAKDQLPEGFYPQPATPFPGKPASSVSGSELARIDRLGKPLADWARGETSGMSRLTEYSPTYLDKAGAAFDPANNLEAATAGDQPIDFRGFAFDGPAKTSGRGVEIVIDGEPYVARYGLWRGDIAEHQESREVGACGYVLTLAPHELAPGRHSVSIRLIAADGRGYFEGPEMSFKVV
jgi:acetyltransferase-like isoleucine patch superfamily enzyme